MARRRSEIEAEAEAAQQQEQGPDVEAIARLYGHHISRDELIAEDWLDPLANCPPVIHDLDAESRLDWCREHDPTAILDEAGATLKAAQRLP